MSGQQTQQQSLAIIPSAGIAWVDSDGRPTTALVQAMNAIVAGRVKIPAASSDSAAASAGVPVGGFYNNSGTVMVRQS